MKNAITMLRLLSRTNKELLAMRPDDTTSASFDKAITAINDLIAAVAEEEKRKVSSEHAEGEK